MARDIYQIGIDAVNYIKSQEKREALDDLLFLKDYEHVINYEIYECLLDYNSEEDNIINLVYPCVVCYDLLDIECELEDFDPDMCYCGKDPSCCP